MPSQQSRIQILVARRLSEMDMRLCQCIGRIYIDKDDSSCTVWE
jgi:hypothetical protein